MRGIVGSERILIGSEVVVIRSERGCDHLGTSLNTLRNRIVIRSEVVVIGSERIRIGSEVVRIR